jgi:enoyl-CoA hydratase/carnithine racemase
VPVTEPSLRLELGRITRIVLNRPDKHNAMTVEMGRALAEAVAAVNQHDAARVVLVEGEGRAFCAGGDFEVIDANARRTPEQNRTSMVEFYSSYLSVLRLRVPSIAVIHGAAVGAGLCLAMACDLRLAAREAKLGSNFVRVGLHPGMGCSVLMPRLIGASRTAELLLTGKLLEGAEAERIGLVNSAVPREELPKLVADTAEQIASAAPIAVAQAKATMIAPLLRELDAALEREACAQAIDFTTGDLREAVTAFRAGRAPQFSGT